MKQEQANIFLKSIHDIELQKYGKVLTTEERKFIDEQEIKAEKREKEQREIRAKISEFLENVPPRYKDSTFDNFDNNEDKVAFLKQGKSAIISGGNGTGKTHLGYAYCRYFAEQGKSARVVLAYKFFDDIKKSFINNTTTLVLLKYTRYDYLVIDEIDKTYGSPTEFVHLYHLVNERYNHLKPTVLITNAIDLIEQVGSSTLDRIASDGAIIKMTGENYRQKGNKQN